MAKNAQWWCSNSNNYNHTTTNLQAHLNNLNHQSSLALEKVELQVLEGSNRAQTYALNLDNKMLLG